MSSLHFVLTPSLLVLAIFAGLAEQYFLSLNENKLDYAVRQGLKTARTLQGIHKKRFPRLGDTIWLARMTTMLAFCFSLVSFIVSCSQFPSWANLLLIIFALIIATLLLTVMPRYLQLTFRRKYIGQLFFSIQIGVYAVFAAPTLFSVSIVRYIGGLLFPVSKNSSLLLPLKGPRANNAGTGVSEMHEPEVTLLQNALDFSKVRVRDCMVPRNEIVAIDIESDIAELKQLFLDTHFSKILVYRDNSENLIGYVHSYELFRKPATIKKILLPVFIVPETSNAQELFSLFVKHKRSIAVVIDEFGGTAGMVTIEDVMEEIFGEIDDEHDQSDLLEVQHGPRHFSFSGRLEIDYLNEKYDLDIPESENYDTLAGFVVDQLEDIPDANACLETDQFLITVTSVTEARIEELDLKVKVN